MQKTAFVKDLPIKAVNFILGKEGDTFDMAFCSSLMQKYRVCMLFYPSGLCKASQLNNDYQHMHVQYAPNDYMLAAMRTVVSIRIGVPMCENPVVLIDDSYLT